MYVPHVAPHWPIHAPEKDIVLSTASRYMKGWDVLAKERHKRMIELIIDKSWLLPGRNEGVVAWEDVIPEYREWYDLRMATFAAMVDVMESWYRPDCRLFKKEKNSGKYCDYFLVR